MKSCLKGQLNECYEPIHVTIFDERRSVQVVCCLISRTRDKSRQRLLNKEISFDE